MAHSFFTPAPENTIEDYATKNEYFHLASNTHYKMLQRAGKYFQLRWQIGYGGKQTNVDEQQVDYVMGSGSHARTYLHRTARGTLSELPLGWYAENGGYWDMSPGYDKPGHPASGRSIGYDCMFCHNAYPATPKGQDRFGYEALYTGAMPQGIDCERCHGPGESHAASGGRQPILNPAHLPPSRQLEVCMQCHLQPTSFPLPNAIKRYDRPFFSYNPAEPLSAFQLYFDKSKPDDRFEIASSAYRLRKSACFLKSAGKLQCTTCHNPHEPHNANYDAACRTCHATLAVASHPQQSNCASCHMPKRRTDDVVHVSVTDHLITRRPPLDPPLHPYTEYRGPVVPYYPKSPGPLYLAIAQVRDNSNRATRIPFTSNRPEPWFETGQPREAFHRDPTYTPALMALKLFEAATRASPEDPRTWNELRTIPGYQKAIQLDPDFAPPHNGLGILHAQAGDFAKAETEFREAIRILPSTGDAHGNLANLLALQNDPQQALYEFELSVRLSPNEPATRFSYAALLNATGSFAEAKHQAELVIAQRPKFAEAYDMLGNLLERDGNISQAVIQYRKAVQLNPSLSRAQLDLGAMLQKSGDFTGAALHLKLAASSTDASVRDLALALLKTRH